MSEEKPTTNSMKIVVGAAILHIVEMLPAAVVLVVVYLCLSHLSMQEDLFGVASGKASNYQLIADELDSVVRQEGLQDILASKVFAIKEHNANDSHSNHFSTDSCEAKSTIELKLPFNKKGELESTLFTSSYLADSDQPPTIPLHDVSRFIAEQSVADSDFERVKNLIIQSVVGFGKACTLMDEVKRIRPHTQSYPAIAKSTITISPSHMNNEPTVKNCGQNIQVHAPIYSRAAIELNISGIPKLLKLPADFFVKNLPDETSLTLVSVIDAVRAKCATPAKG